MHCFGLYLLCYTVKEYSSFIIDDTVATQAPGSGTDNSTLLSKDRMLVYVCVKGNNNINKFILFCE